LAQVRDQIHAAEQLHREEPLTSGLEQLAEPDQVRMVEIRERAKLLLEPEDRVAIDVAQRLERDLLSVLIVEGLVDHAHAAHTELADDLEPIGARESAAIPRYVHPTTAYCTSLRRDDRERVARSRPVDVS